MKRGAERARPLTEDDMTTPRTRAIVSVTAALIVTVLSGACKSSGASNATAGGLATLPAPSHVIVFDNEAREHVHVYLVSDQRQWYLGRVEPGIRSILRVPDEPVVSDARRLQLAVVAGGSLSPRVTLDPRAALTIAEPASMLLLQDWRFAQNQLSSVPVGRTRAGVVRP
jgi:hypothetical protein